MSKPDPVDRGEVEDALRDECLCFDLPLACLMHSEIGDRAADRIRALPSLAPSPLDVAARELCEATIASGIRCDFADGCYIAEDGSHNHADECIGAAIARYREIREVNDAR